MFFLKPKKVVVRIQSKGVEHMRDNDIIDYREEKEPDGKVAVTLLYVLSFFAPILAPLLIWLLLKRESDFVDFHGKQYFNFFLSYTIYSLIGSILIFVVIGFIIVPIVWLLGIIFTIVAAVKSYYGEYYVIPLSIQFFKP